MRIEQKMGEPCRREEVAPQAYREQYGTKADRDDAPNQAEGNEVIDPEDQAAPKARSRSSSSRRDEARQPGAREKESPRTVEL